MSFILLGILNSQAAGGVPEPAFLSSAPLWLDASDASTITESGGSVSQWDNKGTGSNFVQATSAEQPSTGLTTLNDLNVLDFNEEYLLANGSADEWNFMHNGQDYFVAIVHSYNTTNERFHYVVNTDKGNSGNSGFLYGIDNRSQSNDWVYVIRRGVSSTNAVSVNDNGFLDVSFNIVTALLDPDDATAANRISYYKNDSEGLVSNTETNSVSTSDSASKLAIGAIDGSPSDYFEGSIGEFIVVSGADATETNRQAVVDYLNSKWSVF